ncbi:putative membrane protein [Streptococcus mitis]|uniref:Putative membrane protein n=1 Tax=Streptococcus mitis TaxID=28037 RepID=A0A081PRI9_STRMT|nr:putative membrane protein [Streptococcus mitis]
MEVEEMLRKEKARKRFCFWFIIFILYLSFGLYLYKFW